MFIEATIPPKTESNAASMATATYVKYSDGIVIGISIPAIIPRINPNIGIILTSMGNILALKRRAQWRNIDVSVTNVTIGDSFDSEEYDIVFLGGGQDYEQEIIQKDVLTQKGTEIKNAVEGSKVFLCICGGYQLMGKYYKTWDGKELEYLGAIDLWTIGSKERMIGNIVFESELISDNGSPLKIVGFENHSGRTYLGESVRPLGKVLFGNGNNGTDGFEGAVYKNVYCSYSHVKITGF